MDGSPTMAPRNPIYVSHRLLSCLTCDRAGWRIGPESSLTTLRHNNSSFLSTPVWSSPRDFRILSQDFMDSLDLLLALLNECLAAATNHYDGNVGQNRRLVRGASSND
eukprot:scaffold4510_cov183-Amphora_coffeaeformis.AAC.12